MPTISEIRHKCEQVIASAEAAVGVATRTVRDDYSKGGRGPIFINHIPVHDENLCRPVRELLAMILQLVPKAQIPAYKGVIRARAKQCRKIRAKARELGIIE